MVLINLTWFIVYLIFHYLEDTKNVVKNTNIVFINLRTFWEEYFIPIRFLRINQTREYHISRNLVDY